MRLFELQPQRWEEISANEAVELGLMAADILRDFFSDNHDTGLTIHRKDNDAVCVEEIDFGNLPSILVNLFTGKDFGVIRSQSTCRFVFPGYDYNFFICLRSSDEITPLIESGFFNWCECSALLVSTDYFDNLS